MGVRANIIEISPEVFAQVERGEEPQVPDGPLHPIERTWYEFEPLFARQGPPLCVAFTGDTLHPQSPHSYADYSRGEHDWYLGFASPRLVRDAAQTLSKISHAQLAQWYQEAGCEGYDLSLERFEALKSIYVNAAQRGSALQILMC